APRADPAAAALEAQFVAGIERKLRARVDVVHLLEGDDRTAAEGSRRVGRRRGVGVDGAADAAARLDRIRVGNRRRSLVVERAARELLECCAQRRAFDVATASLRLAGALRAAIPLHLDSRAGPGHAAERSREPLVLR